MAIPCTVKEDLMLLAPLETMQSRTAKTRCETSVSTKPTELSKGQQQDQSGKDLRRISQKTYWRMASLQAKQLPQFFNKTWYAKPPTYLLHRSFLI